MINGLPPKCKCGRDTLWKKKEKETILTCCECKQETEQCNCERKR